jgi:hypothetical protein
MANTVFVGTKAICGQIFIEKVEYAVHYSRAQ